MSWTNLDYVQSILSSMDGEEVNSVADNTEAQQVLNVLRICYEEIVTLADLSEHYGLFELEASADGDLPVKMIRPSFVDSIEWVKYNVSTDTRKNFATIKFLPVDTFLEIQNSLDQTADNVALQVLDINTSTIDFFHRTDKAPEYYTTADDHVLIFDSYDSTVDTTLQKDKTLCYGKLDQSWESTDTFVPFIDKEFALLLLNRAKALAFTELKQVGHAAAERSDRKLTIDIQKKKRSIDRNRSELDRLPNYGR